MKYWFTLFQVAIICNHQRTVSKTHGAQIEKLTARIEELKVQILYKLLKTFLKFSAFHLDSFKMPFRLFVFSKSVGGS